MKAKASKHFKREIKPVKRGAHGSFLSGAVSVPGIMLHVLAALLPVIIWAVYLFGLRVITVIAACVVSSVGTEALITLILYKKPRISDLTSVVSGVMLALTLPAAVPVWAALIGGVVAMTVKQLSGGAGKNFLNPALASRTVLMLIFGKMMIYTAPFTRLPLIANVSPELSTETAMTALNNGAFPREAVFDLLSGKCAGNMGEISSLLSLIGGIFLISRGIISFKIPAAFLLTVAALTYAFPRIDIDSSYAVYSLLSGGVIFAAVFMATDHTTSPCTTLGQVIFGIGCGGLTVIFRYSGLFYDGAYPAVLIMNELARPLDLLAFRITGPKSGKTGKKQDKKEKIQTQAVAVTAENAEIRTDAAKTAENTEELTENAEITENTDIPAEITDDTEKRAEDPGIETENNETQTEDEAK